MVFTCPVVLVLKSLPSGRLNVTRHWEDEKERKPFISSRVLLGRLAVGDRHGERSNDSGTTRVQEFAWSFVRRCRTKVDQNDGGGSGRHASESFLFFRNEFAFGHRQPAAADRP